MQSRLLRILPFMAGVLLFAYVACRAYLISFTHDEGLTYQHFIYPTAKEIFSYSNPDPNNHLLNTLIVRFVAAYFPLKDYILRIHSVLFYLLYLFFSWRLAKDFQSPWLRFGAFLFLNCIPYLLDFFSMARGYGMSYAFMMGSLYYLKRWLENSGSKPFAASLGLAGLAVLSSFVTISFYLSLCAVIFLALMVRNYQGFFRKSWRELVLLSAISLPLLSYVIYISFKMQNAGQLYVGTNAGFWTGTIRSLITRLLYMHFPVGRFLFGLASFSIALILGSAAVFSLRSLKLKEFSFLTALTVIVILCGMSVVLQHYLLDVIYVSDRTALFLLIPFLVLTLELFRAGLVRFSIGKILFVVGVLASVGHFLYHSSFSYFLETTYDASTKRALQDLKKYREGKDIDSLKGLYVYWVYQPASAFYQASEDFGPMKQIERYPGFDYGYDYYYIPDSIMYELKDRPIRVIADYPITQSVLLENLQPEKEKVHANKFISFRWADSTNNHAKILDGKSVAGKTAFSIDTAQFGPSLEFGDSELPRDHLLRAEVNTEIWCPKKPGGDIVVEVRSDKDSLILWNAKKLDNIALAPRRWMQVSYLQNLPPLDPGKKYKIRIMVWNTGREPVSFSKLEAAIVDQPDYGK
jgi:hypothetical protein